MMNTRNLLTAIAVAMTLSFAAYAGNPSMHISKENTKIAKHDMMNNMQTENHAIMNTDERVKHKTLYSSYEKMHEKMATLGKNGGIDNHQEDTHAIEILEEYQTD